ncbi:MAG: nucleotidyltransferase family protein [Saprospiraceae bacterium]|nr:nucleotidyltransferase family protein [Saprospiraceae bacterium]
MENTGIIILAAGRSARLGGIKQLLPLGSKTFIQHITDIALEASPSQVLVVTGAYANEVEASIHERKVQIVYNERWEEGKGTGIVAGIHHLTTHFPEIENVIIAVCDQPFVTASLFQSLHQIQQQSGKNIVAAAYANTFGTPVLFTRKYLEELLQLSGDAGAKKIMAAHRDDVATVPFPEGEMDVDTVQDYEVVVRQLGVFVFWCFCVLEVLRV